MDDQIVSTIDQELQKPVPDPEVLPPAPPGYTLADEQAVSHLCRAILKAEASYERLEIAMEADLQAWRHMLAAIQAKRDSWRAVVRDFILRRDGQGIKTPFLTASVSKGRTRLDVKDEPGLIAMLESMKANECIRITKAVNKKEFEAVYNSLPKHFVGLVDEVVGEPVLRISQKK